MKTISVENAKRLRELGITKTAYLQHVHFNGYLPDGSDGHNKIINANLNPHDCYYLGDAYTADEVGDMLPKGTSVYRNPYDELDQWYCSSTLEGNNVKAHETMADAMALLLIWLIENGHVNPEELS
jgi:hypothetical protein